jgi:hypothetical protein
MLKTTDKRVVAALTKTSLTTAERDEGLVATDPAFHSDQTKTGDTTLYEFIKGAPDLRAKVAVVRSEALVVAVEECLQMIYKQPVQVASLRVPGLVALVASLDPNRSLR